jgi:hypothetical protein
MVLMRRAARDPSTGARFYACELRECYIKFHHRRPLSTGRISPRLDERPIRSA